MSFVRLMSQQLAWWPATLKFLSNVSNALPRVGNLKSTAQYSNLTIATLEKLKLKCLSTLIWQKEEDVVRLSHKQVSLILHSGPNASSFFVRCFQTKIPFFSPNKMRSNCAIGKRQDSQSNLKVIFIETHEIVRLIAFTSFFFN